MWIRWALISQVAADISLGQRVFCICIFLLDVSLCVCVYVCVYASCVTSVSVLPSVGFLVKRAHKCLTDRAVVIITPRDIIEETLMYIANYQKWQNSSYTRSSGSTYVSSRTIKDYAGWYRMSCAMKRERKFLIRSLLRNVDQKSEIKQRVIPNYILIF